MSPSLTDYIPGRILAAYRCGSRAYGLEDDSSDEDAIVIAEGIPDAEVIKGEGMDLFVFSDAYFAKICSIDPGVLLYFAIWADSAAVAKDNLICLDESYAERFGELTGIDWGTRFLPWVERVVEYFSIRMDPGHKPLYHLLRMAAEAESYAETGVFDPSVPDGVRESALRFKRDPKGRFEDAVGALERLKRILKEGRK